MSDPIGKHDLVRYSLLNERDVENQDVDLLLEANEQDDSCPRTMPRSSFGPAKTYAGRLRGSQRILFLAILMAFLVIIVWLLSNMDSSHLPGKPLASKLEAAFKPDGSQKAAELRITGDASRIYEFYQEKCYKPQGLGRSIIDVYKKLQILRMSDDEDCYIIWKIFDAMFRIEAMEAPLSLPLPFQEKVKAWLGGDDNLFEQVNHQVIYKISNKGTFEETVFNPIRSRRPQSKPSVDPLVYIKNLTENTQTSCDFCQYKDHTAEDIFGRIDNKYSASCSNTFKLAKFHALFFPKQHSPLNLTLEQIEDLFLHTSKEWFAKAQETDSTQVYPSLMWDSLPHAGASQVHPHIHGVLNDVQYVGGFESWHQVSLQYYKKWKRSFWSDFVKLHSALGLAHSSDKAVVIIPLAARKDHEFMILSPDMNVDVTSLIFKVLQTYQNKLGVYCFSCGGVYPKLVVGDDGDTGMPVVFRIGSRGTCSSVGSDVSSLELYTMNNINSDLAKTYNGLIEEL